MMNNLRRQSADQHNQESTSAKSYAKKPPLGNRQPTMPSWEKNFCKSVGCISWYKIVEMQRDMHIYDNVINWNDSAGEEAFHNAKSRFYANIHGLPCDISLPDPDKHIDEIDWNSQIDPQLVCDLDPKPIPKGEEKYSGVVIMDDLLKELGFSGFGWGDCEEKVENDNERGVEEKGWGNFGNNTRCLEENNGWGNGCNNNKKSWDQDGNNGNNRDEWGDDGWNSKNSSCQKVWGDGSNNNDSWGQNKFEDNNYRGECGNGYNSNNSWGRSKYKGKQEGSGGYMSRYKTSRFNGGGDDKRNPKWRNGSGKNNSSYADR